MASKACIFDLTPLVLINTTGYQERSQVTLSRTPLKPQIMSGARQPASDRSCIHFAPTSSSRASTAWVAVMSSLVSSSQVSTVHANTSTRACARLMVAALRTSMVRCNQHPALLARRDVLG
jgi:hypothetical protein